jgi:hypothetical protein
MNFNSCFRLEILNNSIKNFNIIQKNPITNGGGFLFIADVFKIIIKKLIFFNGTSDKRTFAIKLIDSLYKDDLKMVFNNDVIACNYTYKYNKN